MKDDARNFTDADIDAIVKQLKAEFFSNLGRGIWDLAWKGILLILIAVSLYGAHLKNWSPW